MVVNLPQFASTKYTTSIIGATGGGKQNIRSTVKSLFICLDPIKSNVHLKTNSKFLHSRWMAFGIDEWSRVKQRSCDAVRNESGESETCCKEMFWKKKMNVVLVLGQGTTSQRFTFLVWTSHRRAFHATTTGKHKRENPSTTTTTKNS